MRITVALVVAVLLPSASQAQSSSALMPASDASVDSTVLQAPTDHTPGTWGNFWTDVDNRRYAPSVRGSVGLLRASSAALGREGVVRLGAQAQYLRYSNFPVQATEQSRALGSATLSYVPFRFFEVYGGYGVGDFDNSRVSSTTVQYLGNLSFGLKLAHELTTGWFAGVDLAGERQARLRGRPGNDSAYAFAPSFVTTLDLRALSEALPIVLHGNAGVRIDRTRGSDRDREFNASEEYVYGLNRHNRVVGVAAMELPLPVLTPFAEFRAERPFHVPDNRLVTPDGRVLSINRAMPMSAGVGLRLTAIRDLTLTAAGEFSLNPEVALGVPGFAPWNVALQAAYNFTPFSRPEPTRIVERIEVAGPTVVAPATKPSQISGVVIDALTQAPIDEAILAIEGSELPPVASASQTGKFLTQPVQPGTVRLMARRSGYKDAVYDLTVTEGDSPDIQVALLPLPKESKLTVTATGDGKPVTGTLKLQGPLTQTYPLGVKPVVIDAPRGRYTVSVEAENYLSQTRELELADEQPVNLTFELQKAPTQKLVKVEDDRIQILQPIRFATGKAVILPQSHALLDQIVDALVRNNVKKTRVEGHTDNRGDKERNRALSEERARSVADYLVKKGVSPDALAVEGFGDSRPIAPNLTARGRELNRRVEFVILER